MKIARVLVLSLLALPMMGAEDSGCGGGTGYQQPGVVPPSGPKCTSQTCAKGCCVDDVCYTNKANQTRDTCGSFGVACEMCQTLESCQEDPVKGWMCVADPVQRWAVQPVAAWLPALDPSDGAAWDADDSEPDVVVELSCPTSAPTAVARTSEVSSYTPVWSDGGCSATAQELLKTPVSINIIDVDAVFDDQVFSGSYAFKEADFQNGFVDIPIAADASSTLRLRISRAQ